MMIPSKVPTAPFALRDLAVLDLTRHDLRRMVRDGLVRHVTRGAYAPSSMPDDIETRARTIALVTAAGHVVTDRTAAWLHGIDTLTYAEHDNPPPVDSCALRGRNPTEREGVAGRTRDLAPEDIVEIAGVRVTTPLRTALDLGCLLKRREAKAALDAFARVHGITAGDLALGARRFAGRRGVRQLRELIALVNPLNESPRESWTELAILDDGLPAPESQWWIEVDGVPRYRLDLAYPYARIAVEYDGWEAHERTPEQRREDDERRAWLREHGWTVIVVRRGDFTGDRLHHWLQELRDALQPTYSTVRRMERNSRLTGPEA